MKAKSSFIFRDLHAKHAELLDYMGRRYGVATRSATLSRLLDEFPDLLKESVERANELTNLRDTCLRYADQVALVDTDVRRLDLCKKDVMSMARTLKSKLPKQLRLD